MIRSIRLVCWRSHRDTKLEFRPGTNLLVGIMGAGKSSVMEAISFALFGTFPALERRKLKLENIVRQNEPLAKVVLEFEWGGEPFRIERTIERSKKGPVTHAEIYRAGALAEHGPVAVNTYVSGLIGVDYDLFTRAIYSEQNNIDYFLNLGPGRRKEEMDALLGLDRFEAARANAVSVINRFRAKRQAIEERFSREKLEELGAREKRLAEESAALAESLRKSFGEADRLSRAAADASARFQEARKSRESYESLARDEARLGAVLDSLKKGLEGKAVDESALDSMEKRLEAAGRERSGLAAPQKELDARISALSKEAGAAEAGIRTASEAAKRLESLSLEIAAILGPGGMDSLAGSQKEASEALLSAESERKSVEREMLELSDSIARLKPGLSECPLCSAKLTEGGISHVKEEKARLSGEKRARLKELETQIAMKKKENEALAIRLRKAAVLSEQAAQLRKDGAGIEGFKARKREAEGRLPAAVAERKSLADRSEALSAESERLRAQISEWKGLLTRKAEAESAAKRLQEVRSALAGLRFDPAAYDAAMKAGEEARIAAERAVSSAKGLEAQAKMSSDMLAIIREELAVLRKAAEDARGLAELEEQLAIFKNALLETQISLRLSLADAINAAMNEIWPVFYPYRNYRAIRLGVSEKDYVFEVDNGSGAWVGLESVASGGERACAALTLRVALAMVLTPKLGWLILDEPTHNLDSEAVEMLSSALEFKVPEVVKQTFVITHDEAFMGSDFASSYRLTRDKENDGETRAEPM